MMGVKLVNCPVCGSALFEWSDIYHKCIKRASSIRVGKNTGEPA